MTKRRRGAAEASVSFLDVISCGFGAIVLLLIIAPVGDPTAQEELEETLQAEVQQLTEELFDARGETVALSEDLKSRKEQLSDLEQRVARLKAQLASVEKQSSEIAQSKIVEEEQLRLALQVLTLTIAETAPGVKGATATGRTKPATLTTGLEIQVPEYLEAGESVLRFVSLGGGALELDGFAVIAAVEVPIDHRLEAAEIESRWKRVGGHWLEPQQRDERRRHRGGDPGRERPAG